MANTIGLTDEWREQIALADRATEAAKKAYFSAIEHYKNVMDAAYQECYGMTFDEYSTYRMNYLLKAKAEKIKQKGGKNDG